MPHPILRLFLLAAVLCCFACAAQAQTASVTAVYNFPRFGGYNPEGGLALGNDGNFYGTTAGDSDGYGSVFQITPSGALTTLYTFEDGQPFAGLTLGSDGNFYGVLEDGGSAGGSRGHGAVFQVTTTGTLTRIYDFTGGADGGNPIGALTQNGSGGDFYGTTSTGGGDSGGTVFKITTAGVLTTLHTFTGGADGALPQASLTLGSDGNFYGVTTSGGATPGDYGAIFKMTPAGVLTPLYAFTDGADGEYPEGSLVEGKDGNFYGVTYLGGGSNNAGTIFKITPAGVLTTLYTFTGGADGADPQAGLALGGDGNFYGTTVKGGDTNEDGTIFQITPAGVFTTLYTFAGSDGSNPVAGLTLGADGNFYGVTGNGGQNSDGVFFRLTILAPVLTSETANAQVGSAFSYQIAATNSPFLYGATDLPPGLSVNDATGLISGTPTQSGTFTIQLAAANSNGSGSGTLTLTVEPIPILAPEVTSGSATAQVNAPFSYQIVATNSPASYAASNLPAGLSVDAAAGLISGTPTQTGTFTIGLSATNSGGTGNGSLSLTVSAEPVQPPAVTSDAASAQVGSAFSFQIVATNSPTSFGATGLPAGLSVDAVSGLISGTPTQSGTFTVSLSATNSAGTGSGTLTLTVNPASPVITSALTASGQAGVMFFYQITASNMPTSFGASGLPAGLSVDPTIGLISGTPTVSGTFQVGLSAANAGGTGASVLNLTLAPDLPAVTLAATVSEIFVRTGKKGKFTLSLPAPAAADLVIKYKIKGTAINGVDYKRIKTHQTIPAGSRNKVIKIVPQGDLEGAPVKIVTLVLEPGEGYTVGTTGKVKVKILALP